MTRCCLRPLFCTHVHSIAIRQTLNEMMSSKTMMTLVVAAMALLSYASAAERSLLQAGIPNFPTPNAPPKPPPPSPPPSPPPTPPPSSPGFIAADLPGCESILWIGIFQHFTQNFAAYQQWMDITCSIPHITLPDGNIQQIDFASQDFDLANYLTARDVLVWPYMRVTKADTLPAEISPASMEYKIVRDFTTSACMALPVRRWCMTIALKV